MDEAVTRRSLFYQGRKIKLADGQSWIFPSASVESGADFTLLGPDYRLLLRAVREAEDEAETRLSELALAIFLLGCNYELSPIDYQRLLGFPSGALSWSKCSRNSIGSLKTISATYPMTPMLTRTRHTCPRGQSTRPETAGAEALRRVETPGRAVKGLAADARYRAWLARPLGWSRHPTGFNSSSLRPTRSQRLWRRARQAR